MITTIRKSLLLILTGFSVMCIVNSCQEFIIDTQNIPGPKFESDALEQYSLPAQDAKPIRFTISSNSPWRITSDSQWCSVKPGMSASSALIADVSIVAENNNLSISREAVLTISADDVRETQIIRVLQMAKEDFNIIPFGGVIPGQGGKITFSIISNVPWTILPSDNFLQNIDKMKGEGNGDGTPEVITIDVPENLGLIRKGTITVKTALSEKSFEVKQDGIYVSVDESSLSQDGFIEFPFEQHEQIITVNSNTKWDVVVSDEFADWIKTEKINDTQLKISLLKYNDIFIPKVGQIELTSKTNIPGFENQIVSIRQVPAFIISNTSGSPTSDFELNNETGSVKIYGLSNNVQIESRFTSKKAHFTYTFENLNFTDLAKLSIANTDIKNNVNYTYMLTSATSGNIFKIVLGKTGPEGGYEMKQVPLTNERINQISTIETFCEDDPDHPGRLRFRLLIDGQQLINFTDKYNLFEQEPSKYKGFTTMLQFMTLPQGTSYTMKSIKYESLD